MWQASHSIPLNLLRSGLLQYTADWRNLSVHIPHYTQTRRLLGTLGRSYHLFSFHVQVQPAPRNSGLLTKKISMNSEGNKLYVLCKGAVSQLSSLVHFLITTNHMSLFATKIDKLLENDKLQPRTCQTNMSPKHFFQRRKQQNDERTLKNCQANMFSKSKISDSVSVFFKFVHPCLLLYLLCYSYVCFTPFGGTKFPMFEF